ncbi:histidine kinase [Novimethylophilus kurashikiensis]|uniref:Histidine kinase n=1 Tax=Novimethylophilus kurashikiensis TaxID=1825523 RepID=A0A2R5F9J3_9PROT|nr:ATP-binding protein [Novimethylophilus kurashikiensis]GBG14867.1 histidine kinase [Novimethylophilus kurashikiensis]
MEVAVTTSTMAQSRNQGRATVNPEIPNGVMRYLWSIPMPAWLMDRSGTVLLRNRQYSKLQQCPSTCDAQKCSELGNSCAKSLNPDLALQMRASHRKVVASQEPDVVEIDDKNGNIWCLMLFPVQGDELQVGGIAANISLEDRQQTENCQTQLRKLATEFQFIREEERAEVARNIHDHLGQEITVLKLAIHRLQSEVSASSVNIPSNITSQVSSLMKQVDAVMVSAKRIAYELKPDVLRTQGLAAASSNLVIEFCKRIGIRGNIEVCGEWTDPEPDMALQLYRSLQELLTNLAKHSKASSFFVRLQLLNNDYKLEVTDNGVGFPASVVAQVNQGGVGKSLGLRGFFERAAMYGGAVKLLTRPDIKGSSISLVLPVQRVIS